MSARLGGGMALVALLIACEPTPMQKQINASTARHAADGKREAEGGGSMVPTSENGPGGATPASVRADLRVWARTAMAPLDEVVVTARNSAMRSKNETKVDFEKALQAAEARRVAIQARIEGLDALDEPGVAGFKTSLQSQLDELKTLVEPLRPR